MGVVGVLFGSQVSSLQYSGHRVQTYAHLDVILLACQTFVEGEEKSCCNYSIGE